MSRNAQPRFVRMPGSVILTLVFLWIAVLVNFAVTMAVMESIPLVGILFLVFGFINMALAMGIGLREKWAGSGTAVWTGIMIPVCMILSIEWRRANQSPWDPNPSDQNAWYLLLGLYILVAVFVTRQNTRKWCGLPGERRSGFFSFSSDREPEKERVPTRHDQVELIGDFDEYGLRAGSVGTIIDVHDDPISFEVEFLDDRTWTAELVTLRPDQLRPVAKPR